MRELVLLLLLVATTALVARGQVLHGPRGAPQQRSQFLDATPFSLSFRQRQGGPRPINRGPSAQGGPFVGPRPQSFHVQSVGQLPLNPRPDFKEHFQPQEDVSFSGDEAALQGGGDFSSLFSGEESVELSRENVDQGGFPTADLNAPEPQEYSLPSTSLEGTSPQEVIQYEEDPQTQDPTQAEDEYQPQVTTQLDEEDLSQITTLEQEEPQLQQPPYQPPQREEQQPPYQPPQQEEQQPPYQPPRREEQPPPYQPPRWEEPQRESPQETRYPQYQFSEAEELQQQLGQQQHEQETQEILEIVSLPRPIHRPRPRRPRPRPQFEAVHRRPAHPNQLPLYNVIGEEDLLPLDSQESETRERPLQVVYQYEDELDYEDEEDEDEEEEEPDRLAILLLNSHFNCLDKNNGYYADEEVECEVFHYCQDRVKHSWLCPEGASFHQVHLICMPRSEDNICAKSSTFHFVNDFLYKELEGKSGGNKTYADRYYPEGFEFGLAAVDTTGQVAAAQAPQRPGHAYVDRQPPRQPQQQPQYQEDLGDPYIIRRPEQFSRPQQHPGGSQGFARQPLYRTGTQGYENLEEVLAQRRPG